MNKFLKQLKNGLVSAIVERESVSGQCESLNNLLCDKIAEQLRNRYSEMKISHTEYGLCRCFWDARYGWIEQDTSIMLSLSSQPIRLDPVRFNKEEEAIILAYNKTSALPNAKLLKILESSHSDRNIFGVWRWELPFEKIEDSISGDCINFDIVKSPWCLEL